jgi:uncharacterized surface protein with fasciclin (FAS1) repeats
MLKFTKSVLLVLMMIPALAMAKGAKAPGEATIYQIAKDDGRFTVLVSLLEQTGLDVVLDGKGQYTVFAPTDAAFGDLIAALTVANIDVVALLSDNDFVTDVLLYHVTGGRRFSNSVVNSFDPKAIEMLNGGIVISNPEATLTYTNILTNDAGLLIDEELVDLNAKNGVIHAIDAVLVP